MILKKNYLKTTAIAYIILLLLTSYVYEEKPINNLNENPRSILKCIVDTIKNNSIKRRIIDWDHFGAAVNKSILNTPEENILKVGVQKAIELLDEPHTWYVTSEGKTIHNGYINCFSPRTSEPRYTEDIGYIRVKHFPGIGGEQAINYAQGLQSMISNKDNDSLLGWVIDLRGNTGGDMWPMLTGLGPLLGDSIIGHFKDPDEKYIKWKYYDGKTLIDNEKIIATSDPYDIKNKNPKIVVWINKMTASSGEAVAIAFKGKSNTYFIGEPTCGLTTANQSYIFSDGSKLVLTVASFADRNMNEYSCIEPDTLIVNEAALFRYTLDLLYKKPILYHKKRSD